MAIRVILTVDIRPGQEGAFEEEFAAVARDVAATPGNIAQTLCRDDANESRYHIMTDWSSRQSFHAFEQSPEQEPLTAPVRRRRLAVQMRVLEIVLSLPVQP